MNKGHVVILKKLREMDSFKIFLEAIYEFYADHFNETRPGVNLSKRIYNEEHIYSLLSEEIKTILLQNDKIIEYLTKKIEDQASSQR